MPIPGIARDIGRVDARGSHALPEDDTRRLHESINVLRPEVMRRRIGPTAEKQHGDDVQKQLCARNIVVEQARPSIQAPLSCAEAVPAVAHRHHHMQDFECRDRTLECSDERLVMLQPSARVRAFARRHLAAGCDAQTNQCPRSVGFNLAHEARPVEGPSTRTSRFRVAMQQVVADGPESLVKMRRHSCSQCGHRKRTKRRRC